jgi:hypothetical protein
MVSFSHRLVALKCKIAPGGFSGERIFEVTLADGESYRSLAPRQFCWNSNKQLVAENEPSLEVEGMVAARVVDSVEDDHNQVIVEVPDGEIIAVDTATVEQRPSSIQPPVESNQHVSV